MASVSDFVQDSATVVVEFSPEQKLTVRYRPNKITADSDARLRKAVEDGDAEALGRYLHEVIIDWDLYGPLDADVPVMNNGKHQVDDGGNLVYQTHQMVSPSEIIPLRANVLKYLPNALIIHVWTAIATDANPNPRTAAE